MVEYRYLKRTCPNCGTNLNAHRSAVISYNRSQPMGFCPTCGRLNPLKASKKRKPKETTGTEEKELITGDNEA